MSPALPASSSSYRHQRQQIDAPAGVPCSGCACPGRLGCFGARGQGFLVGLIKDLVSVEVVIRVGVVILQLICQGGRLLV
jgi:hypothetical protein